LKLFYVYYRDKRIQELESQYEAVRLRLEKEISTCAPTDLSTKIHEYITKILSRNQADSVSSWSITVMLYERFGDIYPNHNWIFYAAWKFNPVAPFPTMYEKIEDQNRLGSYHIHHTAPSRGFQGITKNGAWTVLWVGHAVLEGDNTKDLHVNEGQIQRFVQDSHPHHAYDISVKIQQSYLFSGRTPVAYMVITNPPKYAEAGNPRLANNSRPLNNILKRRINTKWFFKYRRYTRFGISTGTRLIPVSIDVVIM